MDMDYLLLMSSGFLIFFAVGQLFVPGRTQINMLLCMLLVVCFVWITHAIGFRLGMLDLYPHLNKVHVPFLAATGPLWYLYVRAFVTDKIWTAKDRKHLLPVVLCVVFAIPFFLQAASFKQQYIEVNVTGFVTFTIYVATRIAEVAAIVYPVLAIPVLRNAPRQKKSTRRSYSILLGLCAIAAAAAVARMVGSVAGNHTISVAVPVSMMLVAFILFYCFGNRYPHLLGQGRQSKPPVKAVLNQSNGVLEDYRQRIRENHWHLNPDLKIQDLARRFGVPSHDLSEFINRESGGNFKNFVNALRIEYSKELLIDTENNQTMVEIAHASGFNSVSVFYEQFKRLESVPPARFRVRTKDESPPKTIIPAEAKDPETV